MAQSRKTVPRPPYAGLKLQDAKARFSELVRRAQTEGPQRVTVRGHDAVVPVSDAIVRRWGTMSGTVRRETGHPPPAIDTLLAATALDHDVYLATRNVRDVRHRGAVVFNPWEHDPSAFPIVARQRRKPSAQIRP